MPPAAIRSLFAALIVGAGIGTATPARAVNHPFGSHPIGYAAGAILPGHVPPAALD